MDEDASSDGPGIRLTRTSPFNRSPKLCPRCLKPLSGANKLGAWLVPQDYYCQACGYSGKVFFEKSPSSEGK